MCVFINMCVDICVLNCEILCLVCLFISNGQKRKDDSFHGGDGVGLD